MDSPTTLDLITLGIAGYAAAVSSILGFERLFRERRQEKRRVLVLCRQAVIVPSTGTQDVVGITAVNTGHRAVEVRSPGFEMPDFQLLVMPLPHLSAKTPIRLEDGESAEFYYDHDKLKEAEKEHGRKLTHAYVLDAEGNRYQGEYKANHGI